MDHDCNMQECYVRERFKLFVKQHSWKQYKRKENINDDKILQRKFECNCCGDIFIWDKFNDSVINYYLILPVLKL